MSRIAMISPFPPTRDGIAAYAVQEVIGLRAEGHEVTVFSPRPSAAHHHVTLGSAKGWIALARRMGGFDRAIVQLYPELVSGRVGSKNQRAACWAAVAALARRLPTELRIHELQYGLLRTNEIERKAFVAAANRADAITVHTERERAKLVEASGLPRGSIYLVEHGAYFVKRAIVTQAEAREELGLDPDAHLFLSIGFLQSHKGFDRGVAAFEKAQCPNAEFHVVGSVRVDHPDLVSYANRLERTIEGVPGAHMHRRFVADPEFDLWVTASDTIVLPYREIWSSSVVERAKLFSRRLVVTDVGGLAAQVRDDDIVVADDDGLVEAFRRIAGTTGEAPESKLRVSGAADLESLIRERSRIHSGGAPDEDHKPATDRMMRVGQPLDPARAVSDRTGVTAVKGLIQRVTGWQVAPLIERINELQRSTTDAISRLEEPDDDPEG